MGALPYWKSTGGSRFRTGERVVRRSMENTSLLRITANWGTTWPSRGPILQVRQNYGARLVFLADIRPVDNQFLTCLQRSRRTPRVCSRNRLGSVICSDARTGEPYGDDFKGVSIPRSLLQDDKIIAIHGKENIDTTSIGDGLLSNR